MTRNYIQMHRTDKYSQHSSIIWPVWLNGWVFVYEPSGFECSCSHFNFRFSVCFKQRLLDVQATRECGFTLIYVRNMTRTYSQMQRKDKYSRLSSIIWPIWLNGWVVVYEVSGCGFESSWSHLNLRFRACFEQGLPWHLGNYRIRIHSEMCTWHSKSRHSNGHYR